MENIGLLEKLFDEKIIRVIQIFLANKEKQFYLREIEKETKVPIATVSRHIQKLKKLGIIKEIKISKFKLYQLNENNDVRYLQTFMKKDVQILDLFVDNVKTIPGVQSIILHGDELKDRANVLIIGEDIDSGEVKQRVGQIKEDTKFTVSALVLTREQYEQMSRMGLYSGKKKSLYER
jgi:DNA-binding transcriptional ArsR family regulator